MSHLKIGRNTVVVSCYLPPPPRKFNAWFECIDGCGERHPLNEVIYACSKGNLLNVHHDMAALRQVSADQWVNLFEFRYRSNVWPYGSGVWGKKEWVLPGIEDRNVVSMYEGNTNLFWAERSGRGLGLEGPWIK